jgi:hypothetical protein
MKPANLIVPSWWYLIAAIPLGATSLLSWRLLEAESYKYTFGGLRNIFALNAVQMPELMGILSVVGFLIFFGSAFTAKLHNIAALKIYSAVALLLYGFWSFSMTMWI